MLVHLFIGAVVLVAIVLSISSALFLFSKYLPHEELKVRSSNLRLFSSGNARVAIFEVELDHAPGKGPVVFRFASTNLEKIRESKKFMKLSSEFAPGSTIKLHYVPLFRWVGSFPETSVLRLETLTSIAGAIVAIALIFFVVPLAYSH